MIKETTYANIKEQSISNYVPAGEITRCYSVTFIKEKTYELFGKVIRKKTTSETMPFVFKSLDIAKDFCEVFPTIISDVFCNNNNSNHCVKYYTYRFVKNDKIIGYAKWNDYYMHGNVPKLISEKGNIEFTPFVNDKIIDMFVKDITLKGWVHTHSLNDVKFERPCEYLSELLKNDKQIKDKEIFNEWNFKLVKQ